MIKAKAFAKFNLNLHIIPDMEYKKRTGYFPVHFINCELNLHDELWFYELKNHIDLICDNKELSNKENLVYKTAVLLKNVVKDNTLGAKITLKKNIPIKAGLGGGSSNAAVTLHCLMKLWHIVLDKDQIHSLNEQIGTDTHYCYTGGVCDVTEKGEKNKCIYEKNNKCFYDNKLCNAMHNSNQTCIRSRIPRLWIVLIIPEKQKPSTAWMYSHLNHKVIGKHIALCDELKRAIYQKDKKQIIKATFNDFEYLVREKKGKMLELENKLIKMEADKVFIAGSGPTIVGLFISKKKSLNAYKHLKKIYHNIIWTHTK
jgi:4-diphosphocytidyl-2-C-methyl-D-erythritol kinase